MENSLRKDGKNRYFLKTFFIALLCSFVIFIPFILVDGGRFIFYGDFNAQQIPFYQLAHRAVRAGDFGWNQYTDLGANFIGSYSFYLLGSPFFWLTIPFPNDWIPFLMGPLFMLKFACAALAGYVFLHRYVKNQNFAVVGSLLYAFSGFAVYNIFFFHFHEPMIIFPLMLAALDEYMYKRRRGLFALAIAASCIINYYFFIGQAIFLVIYFFVRLIMKSWKISFKDFLLLALEAIIGVGLACILFVPSIVTVLQNNRSTELLSGWNAVVYSKPQKYINILNSLLFPPDLPARPNFTPDAGGKWSSLAAWLPLFGMSGVIGWLRIKRKHWLKTMIIVLFVMACVPFLNSLFQLLNYQYYARWMYMLVMMMSLATIMALEYTGVSWKKSIRFTFVLTVISAALIGFMPTVTTSDSNGAESKSYNFGLMKYSTRFWTYVAIALLSLALLVFLFQFFKNKESKKFPRALIVYICVISVIYSVFFISIGKTEAEWPADFYIPNVMNGGAEIKIPDAREDGVRVDFYESTDNVGMYWNMQTINAFHSIVPGSIMAFYEAIGGERDVASRPDTDLYALRGLTSVKWLFDDSHDDEQFDDPETGEPEMPGWLYNSNANGFEIWENEYYVPMGFSYDYYITETDFYQLSESERLLVMMKALVIDDNQANTFVGILKPLPSEKQRFSKEDYLDDCLDRAVHHSSSFTYTKKGFTAEINSNMERVVFFSVPYETGWKATVNGETARIIRSNVGFMSVIVPQGEKVVIEFTYRTPGLLVGFLITLLSIILLIIYINISKRIRGRRVRVEYERLPLKTQSFSEYQKMTNSSFNKEHAMVPLEFRVPVPPVGPVYSADSSNSKETFKEHEAVDISTKKTSKKAPPTLTPPSRESLLESEDAFGDQEQGAEEATMDTTTETETSSDIGSIKSKLDAIMAREAKEQSEILPEDGNGQQSEPHPVPTGLEAKDNPAALIQPEATPVASTKDLPELPIAPVEDDDV